MCFNLFTNVVLSFVMLQNDFETVNHSKTVFAVLELKW